MGIKNLGRATPALGRLRQVESHFVGDPVAAYDRMASFYPEICLRRKSYLQSIDRLILARIPPHSRSLLDVGAGNGERALKIARSAGLDQVVLLEPSPNMIERRRGSVEVWPIRAEHLGFEDPARAPERAGREFDVIICLWNVLGHIRPGSTRVSVLSELSRLLSARGKLFLDLTHRYNARSYGLFKSLGRFALDQFVPVESNGDVRANWSFGGTRCSTYGHVFTALEARKAFRSAGLRVEDRMVVDYESGQLRRSSWRGNLLYVLAKAPPATQRE